MFDDAIDAFAQIFTPPFRATLWKSLLLTIGVLAAIWIALDRFGGSLIRVEPPWMATTLHLALGIGLVVGLAFLVAPVTSLVAGFFLDDMAAIVERTVDPAAPQGAAAPAGEVALFTLRFAGLSLLVNLFALALLLVPPVNVVAFLGANGYLLGREYFELAAMTNNFLLNNEITYREYRYRGWSALGGLALFALVCSVGVVVNIDIAAWLFDLDRVWWVAGIAGALVGVVWNYSVSSSFVWRRRGV